MRSFKVASIWIAAAGLLILGACINSERATDNTDPQSPQPETTATTATTPVGKHNNKPKLGGTIVETNGIHLELVPEKEAAATHLDLYVQKGDHHEPIPTAKVVAQVQTPDGKQQSLDMKYDAQGKHYAVVVPGKAAGQYQVKITADISGKKVDGRFNFSR